MLKVFYSSLSLEISLTWYLGTESYFFLPVNFPQGRMSEEHYDRRLVILAISLTWGNTHAKFVFRTKNNRKVVILKTWINWGTLQDELNLKGTDLAALSFYLWEHFRTARKGTLDQKDHQPITQQTPRAQDWSRLLERSGRLTPPELEVGYPRNSQLADCSRTRVGGNRRCTQSDTACFILFCWLNNVLKRDR